MGDKSESTTEIIDITLTTRDIISERFHKIISSKIQLQL
jgi:hypothetical protein